MADENSTPPRIAPLTDEGRVRVERVLTRALEDIGFREWILEDPAAALENEDLTQDERIMLYSLHRVALEEWGLDVRKFRSYLRDNGFTIEQ